MTEQTVRVHVVVSCRRPPHRPRWTPNLHATPQRLAEAANATVKCDDAAVRMTTRRVEWSGTIPFTYRFGMGHWESRAGRDCVPEREAADAAMVALRFALMSLHLCMPEQPEDVRLSMRRLAALPAKSADA